MVYVLRGRLFEVGRLLTFPTFNNNNNINNFLLIDFVIKIKVPLTPKCFLNRNKTLFGVDYFGEKIFAIGLFLDFL